MSPESPCLCGCDPRRKGKAWIPGEWRDDELRTVTMIYDVNSPLFRSFLSQKGGGSDKRKTEEQKPKEQKPKANENKPVMNE
nr:wound-induced basic protein [Ipomoea batatas]